MIFWLTSFAVAAAPLEGLVDEVRQLQASYGTSVMVCAAGEAAEDYARQRLEQAGQLDVAIVRVPTAGDPAEETERALKRLGKSCALRIDAEAAQFTLTRHGDCAPQPPPALPAQPVTSASSTPDSEAGTGGEEPEQMDAKEETAKEEAPKEETAPDPLQVSNRAANEARFRSESLQLRSSIDPRYSWSIVDGRETMLTARGFASLSQDDELHALLDEELRQSSRVQKRLRWVGIGMCLAAPVALVGIEPGAYSENQDRVWTTAFVLGAGGLVLSSTRLPRRATIERQRNPAAYLDAETAEDLVREHNDALYRRLGLEEPAPTPAEPSADEEPDSSIGDAPGVEPATSMDPAPNAPEALPQSSGRDSDTPADLGEADPPTSPRSDSVPDKDGEASD